MFLNPIVLEILMHDENMNENLPIVKMLTMVQLTWIWHMTELSAPGIPEIWLVTPDVWLQVCGCMGNAIKF